MRAIVLASAALALCLPLTACDKAPSAEGIYSLLGNPKQCRDPRGRFAKCQTCPDGSRIWVGAICPTPTPTPPPAPVEEQSADIREGLKPILSNFDVSTNLMPSWGSGKIADLNANDVIGAFRFICGAGQLSYDDPIVYPGQPGKAHLHQYYGNTKADAYSTYASLRASGDSTCNNMGNGTAANRSAYWMPAMDDGKGNAVQPDYVQVYYKRAPDDAPGCYKNGEKICIGIPNGLRFIAGFDQLNAKHSVQPGWFKCSKTPVYYQTKEAMSLLNATTCPVGSYLEVTLSSLKCWNGQKDSPDHMSHLSGMVAGACPTTHPYLLPQFTISAFYSIREGDDVGLWKLSSDHMFPNLPRGGSLHFDYFEAWDPLVKDMWMAHCIGKKLNCSGGDLGNGKQLKGAAKPVYNNVSTSVNPVHLVPLSSIPRV